MNTTVILPDLLEMDAKSAKKIVKAPGVEHMSRNDWKFLNEMRSKF